MKELNHDNLNGFIGAGIESPTIFIVTNYCSKGSLQVTIYIFTYNTYIYTHTINYLFFPNYSFACSVNFVDI